MCVQNLKFLALPIPEILRGIPNNWAVPGYAHTPLSAKFLTARIEPANVPVKFEVYIFKRS